MEIHWRFAAWLPAAQSVCTQTVPEFRRPLNVEMADVKTP